MVDRSGQQTVPFFSQPVRQITLMLIVLGLVGAGAYVAYPTVAPVFLSNPYLNGFIGVVFLVGVLACFAQVFQMIAAVSWIEGFAAERPGHQMTRVPRLLTPLAALLRSRGRRMTIHSSSARSILDSVATRIDEKREITRYIVNLLIFLGLLGTFFGLATTVPALVETIRSLAPTDGESGIQVFSRLMNGLESQLDGMGIAFASSLLGLAGSLVVGLLELFAGHAQNRFYRELEEWMSTITRLSFSSGEGGEGSENDLGVVGQLMDQMAERMEALQDVVAQSDAARLDVDQTLGRLAGALEGVTQRLEAASGTEAALARVAEQQERLAQALSQQVEDGAVGGGMDAESRMRLRSMDVQLLRILEELSAGRQETVADMRTDLAALTRAVRSLSRTTQPETDQPPPRAAGGARRG